MNKPFFIFFRNDDIRGVLDDSLVYLTESLLAANLCISHAVEPANVSKSVAKWLLELKKEYPKQIEIIQHGLDHTIKTKSVKGEFGGYRNYIDQYADIKRGSNIMSELFGDYWFRTFSFPFGTYNKETLLALNDLNYLVITTGVRWTFKRKILNSMGILLRKKHLMGKNIVYNTSIPPGYSFLEIPIVINNTKDSFIRWHRFSSIRSEGLNILDVINYIVLNLN